MQRHRGLDRRLAVKFRRIRNLEENVLYHVAAERTRQANQFPVEQPVGKTPVGRTQWRGAPVSPASVSKASRTARAVASPLAQLLRGPVLGAWW